MIVPDQHWMINGKRKGNALREQFKVMTRPLLTCACIHWAAPPLTHSMITHTCQWKQSSNFLEAAGYVHAVECTCQEESGAFQRARANHSVPGNLSRKTLKHSSHHMHLSHHTPGHSQ
eukprot:1160501-Pelagomonas_calceolata.AAC.4